MFKNLYKKAFVLALFACPLSGIRAQDINLTQPLPIDSTVTKGKLPNGLTYYIKPNAKPEQKVELRLVVKAGSILENDNQQGLAHFMEHMNFNGLKHYPKNELVNYLQKIGVQFGADLNAYTSWDRTFYMLPIPTDKPGNLENGFQIVADWAGGALLTTDEINDERHVILEEARMRMKNANMRMLAKFFPAMTNGSRYAERMPIGIDSIILHGSPDRIREFYHDWYRPDLEAVIVVGDITASKAKELIEKYFGGLKGPVNERPRNYYDIAPYAEKKAMIVSDSEATDYGFTLMYPAHKVKVEKTLGDYRNDLVRSIMMQGLNRKLRDLTQSANPPFAGSSADIGGNISLALNNEGFELDVTPVDNFKTSIDAAIGVLLQVQKFGLSESDIQTSKKQYFASYEKAYNERNTTESSSYTDELANNFTNDEAIPGIVNEYNYIKELLPTITTQDVNAAAQKWLSDNQNYFALITGPSKGKIELPTEDGLLSMISTAFAQQVAKPEDKTEATSLLDKQPVPGKIVSEEKDADLGTITYTLNNGIKVTVKPTDFKKDEIIFSGVKYGGTGQFGADDKANTTFLSSVIGSMGYGEFTPTALHDFLAGKNASVSMSLGAVSNNIGGNSSVKDLSTLLELNYLKLTSPRVDTALFAGYITKMKSQLQFLKANPSYAFQDSLTKVLYHNDPLAPITLPTTEDMDHISMQRVLDIYKQQFGSADGFHFFIVGNVDEDTLKPLLEKYVASLPTSGVKPMYKDNGLRSVTGNRVFKFYRGADQKSMLIQLYHGDAVYSDDLAFKANMLAEAMTIKILDTIREKMQAIYSGGAFSSVVELPYGHYTIGVQMPCGPENVDKILKELDNEVVGYKKSGVSEGDLEKVKKGLLEKHKEALKQNDYWNGQLENILFWGHKKESLLDYDKEVNAVTPIDLKATANELLRNNVFTAVSYPEQSAGEKK